MRWQPIETVPKDGSSILVYFKSAALGVQQVFWHDIHNLGDGIWCVDDNKHGPYALRGYCDGDDTHWMPLPAPPTDPRPGAER